MDDKELGRRLLLMLWALGASSLLAPRSPLAAPIDLSTPDGQETCRQALVGFASLVRTAAKLADSEPGQDIPSWLM